VRTLIVLAKEPRPGLVKTRLASEAGWTPERAAAVAEAFARDTLRVCSKVRGARLVIGYTPADAEGWFRDVAPHAELVPQVEGDLGARIDAAFAVAFESGAAAAVAIGSDTPHLSPEAIDEAFRRLGEADVVLGPARDGGYYLIGLRARRPALFHGIAWSTSGVLAATLERIRRERMSVALLEETFDLDRAEDLEQLASLLDPDGEPCPHTARALARDRS
jgi:uncharacterized protein